MTEPLKSNQYVTTLKLKSNINSLEKLDKIPKNYKKLIKVKISMQDKVDTENDDSYLNYSWENNNNERLTVGGIRYTIWNAKIEHQKNNMYNETNTKILPKSERTGEYFVPTIFYESNGSVYLCIVTRRDSALSAVEELIDTSKNIDIASNHLATNQNMVEWLFWRHMTKKPMLEGETIGIDNLWSFDGNVIDGESSDSLKGRSSQISNLDVTKAVLSLGDPLTASRISMDWEGSKLQFSYSINGIIAVDPKKTILSDKVSGAAVGQVARTYEKLIFIVGIVIPDLIIIFNNDFQNFNEKFESFKQQQALELINKLKLLNDLEDI